MKKKKLHSKQGVTTKNSRKENRPVELYEKSSTSHTGTG
jgi:hypothetical protein